MLTSGLGYESRDGNYFDAEIELGVVIALSVVVIVFCTLKRTRFGRNLYAAGGISKARQCRASMLNVQSSSPICFADY
jgi:simple sugar transport system permease protein